MTFTRPSGVTHRRLLGLLLAGSLALYAFPLWWGIPGSGSQGKTWAFDEIISANPGASARARHGGRYPPFHYMVLRVLKSPVRGLAKLGLISVDGDELRAGLQLLGRLLSVLMATASVYWVYRAGCLLFDRKSALFGAATWAFVTPLAFFAKTVNLDVPYVFWFSLSILFFLRILAGHRLTDYLAFSVTGMLAITTKDQAFALYLLPALALVFDLAHQIESPPSRVVRFGRALLDRRLVLSLIVAVAAFVIVHDLVYDWHGFRFHVETITGSGSDPGNAFPPTVQGHLALAALAARHLAFSMSWPLLGLAGGGLVIAARRRLENRALLLLLLFPVSYYSTFISVIHYHRLRFLLPVCVVFALLAARGSSFAWLPGRRRRWASLALLAMLAWAFAHSLSLDLLMYSDSRYRVEAWIREKEAAGERVLVVGDHRQLVPRSERPLAPIDRILGYRRRESRVAATEYLVLNEAEFTSDERKAFLERPHYGDFNYTLDHRYGRRPALDLLRMDGLSTNLIAVSPELTVLSRVDQGLSIDEMEERAALLLEGGTGEEWSALLDDIRASSSLVARTVGAGPLGYGLGRNELIRGTRPAALVVSGRTAEQVVPRLRLRCVRRKIDCPAAVEVVTSEARQRVDLKAGIVTWIDLQPVVAGSDLLVLVVAVPRDGGGGEEAKAVRVRVRVPRPR